MCRGLASESSLELLDLSPLDVFEACADSLCRFDLFAFDAQLETNKNAGNAAESFWYPVSRAAAKSLPDVASTETFVYLEMWKQLYDWGSGMPKEEPTK